MFIGHHLEAAAGDRLQDFLADGRLIAPFPQRLTLTRGLRLWSDRPLRPGTAAHFVADWLRRAPPQSDPFPSPTRPATHP